MFRKQLPIKKTYFSRINLRDKRAEINVSGVKIMVSRDALAKRFPNVFKEKIITKPHRIMLRERVFKYSFITPTRIRTIENKNKLIAIEMDSKTNISRKEFNLPAQTIVYGMIEEITHK